MFSPQVWDNQHSRSRALAIELSKEGRETIYVNPPSSFAGILRETASMLFNPLRRENVRFEYSSKFLNIWSPPLLPTFYRGSMTPGFDRWLFRKWFQKKIRTIKKPIVAIIAMPHWWDGYLNDYRQEFSATLFDYQDPIGTYARNERIGQRMSEVFTELISHASGIITHTEANYKKILTCRAISEVSLIRNAGNAISNQPQSRSNTTTQQAHPVIGTVGRISQNIDIPLLLKLADRFPACSIVNIGTAGKYAHALKAKKNIILIPPMSEDELRMSIRNFAVGILPYQTNIEGSPLRVYDLLSQSLQVISTNFVDSGYFKDVIHIANSHEEFIAKASDMMSDKKNWIRREVIEKFVSANSWKMRADELILFCESLLGRQ